MQIRQGDVLIERIDAIPDGAKLQQNQKAILARGEATGHAHTLIGNLATHSVDGLATVFEVREAMAMLTHQEHAKIELEPGIYRVVRQREYAEEAPRNVRD